MQIPQETELVASSKLHTSAGKPIRVAYQDKEGARPDLDVSKKIGQVSIINPSQAHHIHRSFSIPSVIGTLPNGSIQQVECCALDLITACICRNRASRAAATLAASSASSARRSARRSGKRARSKRICWSCPLLKIKGSLVIGSRWA
jgi:hypothetical protein